MQTKRASLLLLSALVAGIFTASSFAADFYVATNGSNTTGNGSIGNPWATIEFALGQVPDGSAIVVRPGTYTGRTRFARHFTSGVTVRSEIPYKAVLTNTNDHVITMYGSNVGASHVTVQGFEIKSQPGNTIAVVVHLDGGGKQQLVHDIVLRDNIIHDSFSNDILKINNNATAITVEGNMFYNQQGADEHIDINSVQNVTVQDNVFLNDFAGSGRVNDSSTSSFIVIKDSNGTKDGILGANNITVKRNVFLNWEGTTGHNFVLCGEDGTRNYESFNVMIENNLMLGNSSNVMRAPFGVKGSKDITFRNNTISGNLPSQAFAMRLNREKQNPQVDNVRMYNNIWADPTGTMEDFSDTIPADILTFVLSNNLYWNNGAAIPFDAAEKINYTDDAARVVANPLIANPAGLTIPRWVPATSTFADGSTTIRAAFLRLVDLYGKTGVGSAARDAASAANAPADDIRGNLRTSPDIGCYEQ